MTSFEGSNWISKEISAYIDPNDILNSLRDNGQQVQVQQGTVIFKKAFTISSEVSQAVLKITGLGLYRAKINGRYIDDAVLKPIVTDYRKVVLFDERDVSHLLKQGNNCITIEVGSGWYSGKKKYWDWRMYWLDNPKANMCLDVLLNDGTTQTIVTDSTWKVFDGPITFCCIYDGETFDKRIEKAEWDDPDYDCAEYANAVCVSAPGGQLVPNQAPDIKVCNTNDCVRIYKLSDTVYTYDFGQNCTGWVQITVQGKIGDTVSITTAEQIFDDHRINPETNRQALNTDIYIIGSSDEEVYEPGFTYHGFRYAQITLSSRDVVIKTAKQRHVHSAVTQTGTFWCDNPSIQKLHDACVLTEKNALLGLSLDCTQRDERLGWLGDAWVTSNTCIYNFDMNSFYRRWLDDIQAATSREGDVPFIVPQPQSDEGGSPDFSSGYLAFLWNHYCFYGEKDVLEKHYITVQRYVDYLLNKSQNFMLDKGRYGDWKSLIPGFVRGDPYYGNTLYLYMDICILIKFSQILNYKNEEYKYQRIADDMKAVLIKELYDIDKKVFGKGEQFSTAFALLLGLVPVEDEMHLVDHLVDDIYHRGTHLTTGIFGTLFVMEVLRKYQKLDVMVELILQDEYPSWLDMLKNNTTLTETWDGNDLSRGHCMFGSVDSQIHMSLSGIVINHMDDDVITINPYFTKQINKLACSQATQYGEVKLNWERDSAGLTVHILVPCGVKCRLNLPDGFIRIEDGIWKKSI